MTDRRRRRRIAALALAAALAATPLLAGPPGAKPVAFRPAAPDPKAVETLLKQGQDALLAQDYRAATGAFLDAQSLDPRSLRAVHGLALAHLYLGDLPRAGAHMERALTMAGSRPDRALVMNNAMLQIAMNNPMRALKFLKEYVDAHPKDVDEPLLNALGSTLYLADESARKAVLWTLAADTYLRYQKVIEAGPGHAGKKRWGVEWLPAADVDQRMAAMKKAEQDVHKLGVQTDKAEERVITARRRR
jgi:tetratricopeptide (TPR) repeat protein